MKNRELSLLVMIPPPFFVEGKTSDIFQTYPVSIIANIRTLDNGGFWINLCYN